MKNAFSNLFPNKLSSFSSSLVLSTLVISGGCSPENEAGNVDTLLNQAIDESDLREHIRTLASDEFGGRMPFTEGEEKTIQYLENAFTTSGLEPGNGESYYQAVPLVEIDAVPDETMTIEGGNEPIELRYREGFVALTRRVTDRIEVSDSELVFCGFGIIAPSTTGMITREWI